MKSRTSLRIISFILGLVMSVQYFNAVPVLAVGDYQCVFNYNDGSTSEFPNLGKPIGTETIDVTLGQPIGEEQWPAEPSRIVGKRFVGWFVNDIELTPDTVITSDMGSPFITVEGRWAEYDCADIESVGFKIYNHLGDVLSNDVELTDEHGAPVAFSGDVTEYYINLLGDTEYVDMSFIVHEPGAGYSITFNGNGDGVVKEETVLKTYSQAQDTEVDSGIYVQTKKLVPETTTEENPYNDIIIPVTAKDGINSKTYTFHVKKARSQIKLEYGNTPFGRIAKDYSSSEWTEEERQEERDYFSSTYDLYGQNTYNPKAWGEGTEVFEDTTEQGKYRNYDKDETAVVAYIGKKFTDPGFTVYNENGEIVTLSDSDSVTRTITYDTVPTYNFADFDNTSQQVKTDTLTGAEDENVITLLQDENVRVGVYNIKYEYKDDIFAVRKLIVLPQVGDWNFDGYVNSLDAAMFYRKDRPAEDSLSGRLYLYRAMDLTQDGNVNENDTAFIRARTEESFKHLHEMYTDFSIEDEITQSEYEISDIPDNSKVQMSMDYLGMNNDNITNSADNLPESAQNIDSLNVGDVFWVGYKLSNLDAQQAFSSQKLHSMTISMDYDSRYILPAAVLTEAESTGLNENEQWVKTVEKYNEIWKDYEFTDFTNSAQEYTVNNSTAITQLDNTYNDVKSLVLDIHAEHEKAADIQLTEGEYILRVPFVVKAIPPEGRKVIDASLDANKFTMAFEDNAFSWDTSGKKELHNLMDVLDFRGAAELGFGDEEEAASVNEFFNNAVYTYGDNIRTSVLDKLVTKGAFEGTLPKGMTYNQNLNRLQGTPSETGTFIFYVNNKKLSITIDKAPMKVKAVDKTKRYGDENPEFTLEYDESCIKTSVDSEGLNSPGFTSGFSAPVMSCSADTATEYGEEIPILISGGESDNYYFEYTEGTLTVNEKREITVTDIKNIPDCTSEIAYVNRDEFPYGISSKSNTDDQTLTADGIINNDSVQVSYSVIYPNNTPADRVSVTVSDIVVDDEYGRSKNYVVSQLQSDIQATGKVLDKVLVNIEVYQQPPRQYDYGQTYTYNRGITYIVLTFDNTEVINRLCVGDMAQYGIDVKAYDSEDNLMENTVISEDLKLTVPEHDGMVVKLIPPKELGIEPISLEPIQMFKKEMRVSADNKTKIYGDPLPTFTFVYNSDDFVYNQTAESTEFTSSLTPPTASTLATQSSNVGEYTISLRGGEQDNYEFKNTNATLTIEKRPIDIVSINDGIPALTAKEIAKNPNAAEYVLSGEATSKQLTANNVYNNDDFKITYEAVYKSKDPNDNYTVEIRNVQIDENYGKGKNYSLKSVPTSAEGGVIYDKNIESFTILEQPKLEYTYGETVDLNSGLVKINYDSGETFNVKFSELSAHNISLEYGYKTGDITDDNVTDNDKVNVNDYTDNYMVLKAESIYSVPNIYTDSFVIHKKEMNVYAKNTESIYGDEPLFDFEYDASDFVNGENENSPIFTEDLWNPRVSCDATSKSDVGDYNVTVSGGSANNYEFVYHNGIHSIKKRTIDIQSINGNIPYLTSEIIFNNPGNVHKLDGTAETDDMTLSNLVEGDEIKVTYKAVYSSIEPAENVTVDIESVALDDTFGKSKNYQLGSIVQTADGGKIYDKEITLVEIIEQPKLEYTYGDTLDLSGGSVKITYDSRFVEENIPFNQLQNHRITLTYAGTEDLAIDNDLLNVPYHNGKRIILTPETIYEVSAPQTEEIEVAKKVVNVTAENTSSTYGEEPVLSFVYNESDFVNGETSKSESFINGLIEPETTCTATNKSDAGEYDVLVSGGESNNYTFEYHSGIHTINKRKINITKITGGIPYLTSDIIFAQPGDVHELDGWADNSMMEIENVIEGDEIKITYKAGYDSIVPSENVTVRIVNPILDDTFGKSKNYQLENVVGTAEGGRIYDKEITSVEIIEQPKLEYTYGDTLDLSGGKVKITYDSGLIEENIPFNQLQNHRITLTYSGGNDVAADKDVLNVPYHNGAKITLTPATVHDISAVETDKILVNKKVLTYGECTVNSIVYDGVTTLTSGNIVLIGEENGDVPTASGVFNFDNINAGENKTVYITEIKLDDTAQLNYTLEKDSTTAIGTIEKAEIFVPTITDKEAVLSEENVITITAPEFNDIQLVGGAEYEYSIDNGVTWQKENVFDNLALGLDCQVVVRIAETDNYKQSQASTPVMIKTYLNKITLIAQISSDEQQILASFYTNEVGAEKEQALIDLIGELDTKYYDFYTDTSLKQTVKFPIEFTGDMTFYTSLKKKSTGSAKYDGAGKSTPTSIPTVEPTIQPTTEPVEPSPEPTETPIPTYKPYINGYNGMIMPDSFMTRAEAATIMINLIGDTGEVYENIFPDVSKEAWYEKNISQARARNLIFGFEDGTFRPEEVVTREQFVSMVANMMKIEPVEGESFIDVTTDRWSSGYINALVEKGVISGYVDGTFGPENPIRRSEAVKIINAVTGRIADKEKIDKVECPFVDLSKDHWAYYEFMIAACEF